MAKNVVYPYLMFTRFVDEPIFKRLALFFDSIYIGEGGLHNILSVDPTTLKDEFKSLAYEKAVWEFLLEKGIVKSYPFLPQDFGSISGDAEVDYLTERFKSLLPQSLKDKNTKAVIEDAEQTKMKALANFYLTHDVMVRLDAINLRKSSTSEFYPVLRTCESFQRQEKKSSVIQFLLNDIPQPDEKTPWEHIVEFRADEEVKTKYLALIHWINKTASSSSSISDIKDEYEYLYNDYLKHFKLHKMKYNNSLLEVLVTAGAGMLMALQAGDFVSPFKNLLQMKLSHIKLMEEEAKLPGKEVAYIYHVRKEYGSL